MTVHALDATGALRPALGPAVLGALPPAGSVVALAIANPASLAEAFVTVVTAGCVPLLLPPTLPGRAQRETARRAGAAALLHADAGHDVAVEALDGALSLMLRGYLACTSGTTGGEPTLYAFTLEQAEANARAHLESLGATGARRLVLPMPLAHSFGLVAGLLAARALGAELFAFEDTPSPTALLRVVSEQRADVLYLTPPLMRLLLKRGRQRPAGAEGAPTVVSVGAGPVDRDELRALVAAFPRSRVTFTYGLTELGPRVATLVAGEQGQALLAPGAGRATLGEPLQGVSWQVREERLFVRSPYAAVGRLVDGALQPLPATDGYVDTRDGARVVGDSVEVLGRADGTVVRGGTNVYPEDVEAVALRDEAVTAACCIARPSVMYGEVPVLYCESTDDETALRQRLEARFAAELRPVERPVELKVARELPRSSLGKVLRAALREQDASAPGSGT
ncbi:MAG: acyl--CoA ligase [Sandaracinaceae bacterium]|nr:acyl--CoA ligase [Sandaracinaceae bacterium]